MFDFNFKSWVWNHLPSFFKRLGETSLFFGFLAAMCSSFRVVLKKVKFIQDQTNLRTATGSSLEIYGSELKLKREAGETDEAYRSKLLVLSSIYEGDISQVNLKALTFSFLKVTPEIYDGYKSQKEKYVQTKGKLLALGLFDKRVTEIFKRLVYYILLPDLQGADINRQRYVNAVLQINYGANIPIILEKREKASGIVLGSSALGTIKSYMTSVLEPDIIFVERWN